MMVIVMKRMRWKEARIIWVGSRGLKVPLWKILALIIINAIVADPLVKIERGVECSKTSN